MDVAVSIIVVAAVVVTVCGTIIVGYAWWRGLWATMTDQWRASSPRIRRSMGAVAALIVAPGAAVVALLILAPFGRLTPAYVFGGMAAFIALGVPILAAGTAWQDLHRKK